MNFNASNLINLLTSIVLIAGIALVIVELRQAHDTAKAQLLSDSYSLMSSRLGRQMGENPNLVIAKSCDTPEALTTSDREVLNSWFLDLLLEAQKRRHITEVSDFYTEKEWRFSANLAFRTILSHEYGRYWWSKTREMESWPELTEIGDNLYTEYAPKNSACATGDSEWRQEHSNDA